MSTTLVGTPICDYIFYKVLSVDHSSMFKPNGTLQISQRIVVNT
jgi:hypothetical protein